MRRLQGIALLLVCALPALAQIKHAERLNGSLTLTLDTHELRLAAAAGGQFVVESFPLPDALPVDLVLEPLRVVSNKTQVVLATDQGEIPYDFDPDAYLFFRGTAADHSGSHVILALGDRISTGRIELGPGRPSYGLRGQAGQVAVFRSIQAGVPQLCGTESTGHVKVAPAGLDPLKGVRQGELAIDADYELYELFDQSEQATIDYIVSLYGQISDTTLRDLKVRLDIIFIRVWTTPDDPWGDNAGMPTINPQKIPHDIAQAIHGVKNAGFGGQAQLCGPRSWFAYALGFFTDVDTPNIYTQDIFIGAHEIGHSLGAPHTHSQDLDVCHTPDGPTRRGPYMSYCTQSHTGGSALGDLRFHTESGARIFECLANRPEYVFDCNQNGIDDALDIDDGTSEDMNVNGIPDECEDCNANGILDTEDIAFGMSADLNDNGVPDECEPDCNANGMPDDYDILMGISIDLYGNGIPDECEADCNANGISDYTELQEDMTRDIDRDAVLDECQDCDLDGTPDIIALDGANNAWVISGEDQVIKEYHAVTGVLMRESEPGHINGGRDLLITPDARILVTSADDDRVVEFDRTGAYVGDFATGADGLDEPGGMLLNNGVLLVVSSASGDVHQFDLATGAPLGALIAGMDGPYAIAYGPTGTLLISSDDDRVLEFDAATGAFIGAFVDHDDNGGLLSPRAILVAPDGRVVVSSEFTNELLAFDPDTGAFLGQYNNGDYNDGLNGPWAVRIGPDGHVYASNSQEHENANLHLTHPRIFKYDKKNGDLFFPYVQAADSELHGAFGFDFMPAGADCNLNLIPDACDIASGVSEDVNDNGLPDECENLCPADVNGDGELNVLDFVFFQLAWQAQEPGADCNDDAEFTVLDFVCFQELFQAGCP